MLTKEVIDFIKDTEKLVLTPYKKVNDRWTIGYGNTFYENGTAVKGTDKPITKERALQLFTRISNNFHNNVKLLIKSDVNENQTSALTSLAYNIGIVAFKESSLLKQVNKNPNDFQSIEPLFKAFKYQKQKILKGLIIRREKEFLIYQKKKNNNLMQKIKDFLKEKKNLPIVIGLVAVVGYFIYKKCKR